MKLYEPFTYILITLLIFWVWGGTWWGLTSTHKKACWESNTLLLEEEKYGPLRKCEK